MQRKNVTKLLVSAMFVLIIGVLMVGGGCKSHREMIDDFGDANEVCECELVFSEDDELFPSVVDIKVSDSLLVLSHPGGIRFFSFIGLDSGKLIAQWGIRGHGPGEYTGVDSRIQLFQDQLVFMDNNKNVNIIEMASLLNDTKGVGGKREPYPYTRSFRPFSRIKILDDSLRICMGSFENGHFGLFDKHGVIVHHSFDYPFKDQNIQGLDLGTVYQGFIEPRPDGRRFVVAFVRSDCFEIFDNQGGMISLVYRNDYQSVPAVYKRPSSNRYSVDDDHSIAGITGLSVTDSLICIGYCGESLREHIKKGQKTSDILCFDWEGRKMKKIKLTTPVDYFCVDGNCIYGVEQGDKMNVYKFNFGSYKSNY